MTGPSMIGQQVAERRTEESSIWMMPPCTFAATEPSSGSESPKAPSLIDSEEEARKEVDSLRQWNAEQKKKREGRPENDENLQTNPFPPSPGQLHHLLEIRPWKPWRQKRLQHRQRITEFRRSLLWHRKKQRDEKRRREHRIRQQMSQEPQVHFVMRCCMQRLRLWSDRRPRKLE